MRSWRVAVMGALLIALITGGLYYRAHHNDRPWLDAHVTHVAISPDRRVVAAMVDTYYSGSCTNVKVTTKRTDNTLHVRVRVRSFADFCTTEACLFSKPVTEQSPLTVSDAGATSTGCQTYVTRLDEPLPRDVRLLAG